MGKDHLADKNKGELTKVEKNLAENTRWRNYIYIYIVQNRDRRKQVCVVDLW